MTREEAIAYFEENIKTMEQPPIHLGSAVAVVKFAERCDRMTEAFGMAISALREQPRWISVDERLPEKDGFYLVWGPPAIYTETKWYDQGTLAQYFWKRDITHWMPMPEPPKEEV